MNFIDSLGSSGWTPFATALLHTLWQGGLVSALLYFHLKTVPADRPHLRYAGAVGALLAVLFGAFLTWAYLDHDFQPAQASVPSLENEAITNAPASEHGHLGPELAPISTSAAGDSRWEKTPQGLLILLWIVGVDIMLIRLSLALADLQDIRENSNAPSDPSLLQHFNVLLQRTHSIGAPPNILISNTLAGPVAFGFLHPTIVLPVSLITKTPPVLLEAILAHELAHIRRHDYLVNLGQLLIETLLFFNPAVWWISRQIRVEREACCDADAVDLMGSETDYASALADYASGVGAPSAAALGFGQERGPGTLLERVRRLLVPNYRPTLKLPIGAVTVFLGVSSLILLGLHQGSRMAVAVGAEWLSPEERIAQIKAVQESHPNIDPDLQYNEELARQPESKVRIAGVIKTDDGSPVNTEGLTLQADSERPGYGASHSLSHNKGQFFNAEIQPGQIHLSAFSPHYAATLLGPFKGEIAGSITNLTIVLKKGFTGRLLIQDEEGLPIPQASVYGQYDFPSHASTPKVQSNPQGIIQLTNIISHPMKLRIRAPGFQEDHQTFTLSEGTTETWTLHRAIPTTVFLRSEQGTPVAGATARLMRTEGFHNMSYGRGTQKVYAQSNAAGELTFTELRIDSSYWFQVTAPGYGKTVLESITAGVQDLSLTLGPSRDVRGVITGDLNLLDIRTRWENGRRERLPSIRYRNPKKIKGYSDTYNQTVFVQMEDDRATFEIKDLWPGELILTAGSQTITQALETGLTQVNIELTDQPLPAPKKPDAVDPLPERVVHLRFKTPNDHPKANGPAHVVVSAKQAAGGYDYQELALQVEDGLATHRVPVGSRVRVEPDNFTGYWFQSANEANIPAGDSPFEIDIKCYPAGAIYGTVHEHDGTPAKGIMISVVEVNRAPGRPNSSLDVRVKNSASSSDLTEHFTATPLPIGGTYMIVVHRKTTYAVSPHLTITGEKPVLETALVIQKGITIQGRILKPDGQPAAGINFTHSFRAHPNHGFSTSDQTTDRLGRFTLRDIDPDLPGAYAIRVAKNPGFRRHEETYDPRDEDLTVQLKKGLRVTGQVIDAETGWPIPGVEVYALPYPFSPERTGYLDADATTDDAGHFNFTTLDSGDYRLNIRQGNVEQNREVIVNARDTEPTQLRVQLSEWSKLKPQPPSEPAQQL